MGQAAEKESPAVETDGAVTRSSADPRSAHAPLSRARVWRDVAGFDYLVSDRGDVCTFTHRKIRSHPNHNGYLCVYLYRGKKRYERKIHLLVLEAFRGPRPSPNHAGAHGPKGRLCNELSNLRWATPEENEADKKIANTHSNGRGRIRRRHDEETVREIRRLYAEEKWSFSKLAKHYKQHRSSISRIVRGIRRKGIE